MYSRLIAFFLAVVPCLPMAGCGENALISSASLLVTGLEAASLGPESIGLRWQSRDTTVTGFLVTYSGSVLRDSGDVRLDAAARSIRFDDLGGGPYRFRVVPLVGNEQTTAASITWATARRYDRDPITGAPLRLYERFSSKASGLYFDVATGMPAIADLTVPVTFPPTPVALLIETAALTSVDFSIGPPAAYLRNGSMFDSIAAISDKAYAVESLDDWYLSGPLDRLILSDGNLKAYNRIPASPGNSTGIGFLLRVGLGTSELPYHYARVLVKNSGGKLLQGVAPNRYVELEVSYQFAQDLPYARRTPMQVAYHAERRF